jgi:hypothetical protein
MPRPRTPKILTNDKLKQAGRYALGLTRSLTWGRAREGWLHGVVLGLLEGSVGNMESEYRVPNGRIDFRHGGNNPDCIELVVRHHGNEHYGTQNRSELRKLSRVSYQRARKRILMILDASGMSPTLKEDLADTYKAISMGAGRFPRNPVSIIYVHPRTEYTFRWNP